MPADALPAHPAKRWAHELAHAQEPASPQPPADAFLIEPPTQADAPAIARCFVEVYGHHYPHAEVFDPARYWAEVESGALVPVIARDTTGTIVGHVALEREARAPVAERGEAVVLPACRGHQLLELMTKRLATEASALQLQGVFARPVTIHTFSQRNDVRIGMSFCAASLGMLPENVLPKGLVIPTIGQRQSLLLAFRFLQPPVRQTIHAQARYRDILAKLYGAIGAEVAFADPQPASAAATRSVMKFDEESAGEIRFQSVGRDVPPDLQQMHSALLGKGARYISLSIPLNDPGGPSLAESARDLGYFLSGLGPAFEQGRDVLLLQYLAEPLDTNKLQIYSDHARELISFIDADRAAIGRS